VRKFYEGVTKTKLPATRGEAIEKGWGFFYTGKRCKHGHRVPRYTSNGSCSECVKQAVREWQRKNKRSK